ncbi:MAG: hypothetical protein DRG11_06235 [Epsilonproteobacteria bacterium]|nr:MAG: hypothetical protein DRG11_06235 [Campylobacterota bacterium]
MEIISIYTSEIDKDLEEQIMKCFNITFSENKPSNYFKWKYKDNPFGDSLHVIVIDNNQVIATRVFWRLDINGVESYQCVDTSVLPEYQGKGIFGKTVRTALEQIGDKQIYNYPNENSAPAYLKYGWKPIENSNCIKFNLKLLLLPSSPKIDWTKKQLEWRFENCLISKYYQYNDGDRYYIFGLRREKWPVLLGYSEFSLNLEYINPLFCFSYDVNSKGICIRKKLIYMYKFKNELNLKSYLFDMI